MKQISRKLFGSAFLKDRKGSAAVEFLLVTPLFISLLVGTFSLFDGFRQSQRSEKANYTIGDFVSRRTVVDDGFLDITHATFEHLVGDKDTSLRITSIRRSGSAFEVVWSYATLPLQEMTTAAIPAEIMPRIADQDTVLLVETTVGFTRAFSLDWLPADDLTDSSIHRPRFTASIQKTDG